MSRQTQYDCLLAAMIRIDAQRNQDNKALLATDPILYQIRMDAKTKWWRVRMGFITDDYIK